MSMISEIKNIPTVAINFGTMQYLLANPDNTLLSGEESTIKYIDEKTMQPSEKIKTIVYYTKDDNERHVCFVDIDEYCGKLLYDHAKMIRLLQK